MNQASLDEKLLSAAANAGARAAAFPSVFDPKRTAAEFVKLNGKSIAEIEASLNEATRQHAALNEQLRRQQEKVAEGSWSGVLSNHSGQAAMQRVVPQVVAMVKSIPARLSMPSLRSRLSGKDGERRQLEAQRDQLNAIIESLQEQLTTVFEDYKNRALYLLQQKGQTK